MSNCTSCHSTVLNPITGCGVDPCSTTKLSTDSIFYTGPTLSCSGIDTCTTVTEALQNLDYKICNPPAFTFTANNGLTKTLNNVQLGGALTQQTVIGTTAGNSLVITGLVNDATPDFLVSQDSSGVLTKTAFSAVLGAITANNGLTKTGNNIALGGALTAATTITTTGTNTLTVVGLVTDASPAFIITQAAGGQLVKTLASSIIPTPTPPTTANNGLNMSTVSNVQLGGPLIKNTSVDLATYSLTFRSGVSGQTGIQIIPGAVQDCATPPTSYDWTSDVFNIWGKIQQDGKSWFKDNVGIGVIPDSNNSSCGNGFKLNVFKPTTSFNNTFSAGRGTTTSTFEMIGALGNDASNGEITSSIVGTLYFSSSTNVDLYGPAKALYSGINGRVTFTGANGNLKTEGYPAPANSQGGPGGALTSVASRGLFHDFGAVKDPANTGPSLATYIGFQALGPQPYGGNTYTGTIDDVVGVQIEDQRGSGMGSDNTDRLAGKGLVTNSWGIRQLGVTDTNYFNGPFQLPSSNLSIGTATLVAGTVTVATTAVKTGAKIFLSVNTSGGTQGFLSAPAASIINGTSFVINSTSVTDTSTVNWWIINS